MAKFLTISDSYTVSVSDIVGISVHNTGRSSAYIYYQNNTTVNFLLPQKVTANQFLRLCEIAENSPKKLSMSWEDAVSVLTGKVPSSD